MPPLWTVVDRSRAIACHAIAREVLRARVVCGGAVAYAAGYVAGVEIAGRVSVRGRGGTALQPGIRRLQRADDLPRPSLVDMPGWVSAMGGFG